MAGDAKYWVGICWVSSMRPDWRDKLPDLVELPFAYCLHDKDKAEDFEDHEGDPRHEHIHLILCWPNTTTYKHALDTFNTLSLKGKQCCNKCERIRSIRNKYEYIIHNTDACRKANKHLYDKSERIEGNNFDIGLYEQLSTEDKQRIRREIADFILDNRIRSYHRLYMAIRAMNDTTKEEICASYVTFFSGLCRGYYQEYKDQIEAVKNARSNVDYNAQKDKLEKMKDSTDGILFYDRRE